MGASISYTQPSSASSQTYSSTALYPNTNLGHYQHLPTDISYKQSSHFNSMQPQLSLDSSMLRMSTLALRDLKDKSCSVGVSPDGRLRNQVQHSLSLDNPLGVTKSKRIENVQGVSDALSGNVRQRRAFKIMRR